MTKLLKDEHNGKRNQDEMRDSSHGRWGRANKWTNKMEIMQIVDDVESEDDGHGSAMAVNVFVYVVCCDVDKTMRLHHFSSCRRTRMLNNVKLPKLLHIPRHHNIDDNNFANAFIYFSRDFNTFFSHSSASKRVLQHAYFCMLFVAHFNFLKFAECKTSYIWPSHDGVFELLLVTFANDSF